MCELSLICNVHLYLSSSAIPVHSNQLCFGNNFKGMLSFYLSSVAHSVQQSSKYLLLKKKQEPHQAKWRYKTIYNNPN